MPWTWHSDAMINFFSTYTAMPKAALVLAAASLGALVFALVFQYGFGIAPCELCLWQRVPFGAVAALSLAAFLPKLNGQATRFLFGVCALLLLGNAGLAVFHSGVERHWWEFHSACTGSPILNAQSVDDLRRALLDKPVVRCDQIAWSFLGLSMANFNVAYSFLLSLFAAASARR